MNVRASATHLLSASALVASSATAQMPVWLPARGIESGHHAMAYDVARQRTVLGAARGDGSGSPCETWEWDGAGWSRRDAVGPPGRTRHAMAYDLVRQRVVLFGGSTNLQDLADTWEWDGDAWTQRQPAASPPARDLHAMAYDVVRRRTVLFGGSDANGRLLGGLRGATLFAQAFVVDGQGGALGLAFTAGRTLRIGD